MKMSNELVWDYRNYYISEWDKTGRIFQTHEICMPEDVRGGRYQQICSIEAFRRRLLTFWHEHHYMQHTGGTMMYQRSNHLDWTPADRLKGERVAHPVKQHSSVWEFYRVIGYNHRRRPSSDLLLPFILFPCT